MQHWQMASRHPAQVKGASDLHKEVGEGFPCFLPSHCFKDFFRMGSREHCFIGSILFLRSLWMPPNVSIKHILLFIVNHKPSNGRSTPSNSFGFTLILWVVSFDTSNREHYTFASVSAPKWDCFFSGSPDSDWISYKNYSLMTQTYKYYTVQVLLLLAIRSDS